MKKFTYHLYSKNNLLKKLIDKKNEKKFSFNEEENEEEDESKSNVENNNKGFERRKSRTKTEKFAFSKLNLFFLNDKKQSHRKSVNFLNPPLQIVQEYNNIKNFSESKRRTLKRSSFKSNEKLQY